MERTLEQRIDSHSWRRVAATAVDFVIGAPLLLIPADWTVRVMIYFDAVFFLRALTTFWTGGSPGKLLAGLRVNRTDGNAVNIWRALLREIPIGIAGLFVRLAADIAGGPQFSETPVEPFLITLMCAGVGTALLTDWLSVFGPLRTTAHDYLADTIVIRVR